ncbi:MAG: Abi-alpha family protein [Phycisphaerales bacterium]
MSDLAIVAGAAGAGFGVMKPMAEAASDLARRLLGRPFEVAGEMLGDQIYCWQCVNRIKILDKLSAKVRESNTPVEALPPGFLVPALEAAGNTDHEGLQDLWANLLHSAIENSDDQSPMYVSILRQMGGAEALWLSDNVGEVRRGMHAIMTLEGAFQPVVYRLVALGILEHPNPQYEAKESRTVYPGVDPSKQQQNKITIQEKHGLGLGGVDTVRLSRLGLYFCGAVGLLDRK